MKEVSAVIVIVVLVAAFYVSFQSSLQPTIALPSQISGPAMNYPASIYPTYQISSWQGTGTGFSTGPDGGNFVNDSWIQERILSFGSMLFPWSGIWYAGWCDGANTTSTKISEYATTSSTSIYNPVEAGYVVKYMMPFLISFPLDGYGTCLSWSSAVTRQFPDLITYNISGKAINYNKYSYVRVDDINFARQVYNDLVNLKNDLVATNNQLLNYWYGIDISAIASDHGGYDPIRCNICNPVWQNGGWMLGNNSVINFAHSPQCFDDTSNLTFGSCSFLIKAANGNAQTSRGKPCCTTRIISNLLVNYHLKQFDLWSDGLYQLGIAYAAYNFTQKYHIDHPFVIALSRQYSLLLSIQPSSYPYPYNKSSIESLNLARFLMEAGAYSENAGPTQPSMVSSDISMCQKLKNPYSGIPGGFLSSVAYSTTTLKEMSSYVRNQVYYIPRCASSAIMEPGNLDYTASSPYFSVLLGYGTLLNRMRSLGFNQYTLSSLGASFSCPGGCYAGYGSNYRYAGATNVTLLGSGAGTLLAWFYTNKTSTETVSFTMNGASYGFTGSWIALSALTMNVVGSGSTNTISFTVTLPSQGWNPVYIVNLPSSEMSPLYSNVYLNSAYSSSNSVTYLTSGPHAFSAWLIVKSSTTPTSVSAGGQLQQYSTLSSFNTSIVGMHWSPSKGWQNYTQGGWYYDGNNGLIYVHFLEGGKTSVTISFSQLTTSSSTLTSSSVNSQTTTSTTSQTSAKSITETTSSTITTVTTSTSTSTTQTSQTTSSTTQTSISSSTQTTTSQSSSTSATQSSTTQTSQTTSSSTQFSTSQSTSFTSVTATSSTQSTTTQTTTETDITTSTTSSQSGGFTLTLNDSTLSLRQGAQVTLQLFVGSTDWNEEVSLKAFSPPGIYVTFNPQTGKTDFVSLVTISVGKSVLPGQYVIVITGHSKDALESLDINLQVREQDYLVEIIQPSKGGTTSPPPGNYYVAAGSYFVVSALPSNGFVLEHWVLNGKIAGNYTSLSLYINQNTTVEPVFTNLVNSNNQEVTVIILSNMQNANLTIDGKQYTLPLSFNWDVGSRHSLATDIVSSKTSNVWTLFEGWDGSYQSNSTEVSFTVNGTMLISANYKVKYLTTFIFLDSKGNQIKPQYFILTDNGAEAKYYNLTLWIDNGKTYSIFGAFWNSKFIPPMKAQQFKITEPSTITVYLPIYSYRIKVVDVFGMPISDARVTLKTNYGSVYENNTDTDGIASFDRVNGLISSVHVSYLGVSNSLSVSNNSGGDIQVSLILSYPVTTFAVTTSFIAFLFLALRKLGKI
jgi:hypothetical protein